MNSAKIQITDTTKATKSAMGAAYKIPFNPKNLGKIKTSGIKNNTCLVIDKNIPKYAFLPVFRGLHHECLEAILRKSWDSPVFIVAFCALNLFYFFYLFGIIMV